jgi:hypothetical protein
MSVPGNNKKSRRGGRRRGKKEEGREKERGREREKKEKEGRKWDTGSGSTQPSRMSSSWWTVASLPAPRYLDLAPYIHRVRLAALVAISKSRCVRIANGNSRLVVSSSWQYAATCCAVSRPSPYEQTGVITSGTRRSNRKAQSPILPVLIWTRSELSAF